MLDVLKRTELVGADERRAQDYLEKMVQVRLDLPVLRDAQADSLVSNGIDAVLARHSIELTPPQVTRIGLAYQAHLKSQLTTPRAINRYFAQLSACIGMVQDEVDFVDYMLITYLRTAEPRVYDLLRRTKGRLTGTSIEPPEIRSLRPDQLAALWEKHLVEVGAPKDQARGLLALLALMFVPIESAVSNSGLNSARFEDVLRRKGVGHSDYFDRYFSFGVPEEDISDSLVATALRQLGTEQSESLAELRQRLITDTPRVARKISVLRSVQPAPTPTAPLLALLADAYEQVPKTADMFAEDPGRSLVALGRELLEDAGPDDIASQMRKIATTDLRLQYVARIIDPVRHIQADGKASSMPAWQTNARNTATELIEARLSQDSSRASLDQVPEPAFNLIWIWARLNIASLRVWLHSMIDSGSWPIIDVIARFVTVGEAHGAGTSRTLIGDFNIGDVEAILGLTYVFDGLKDDISEVESEVNAFTQNPSMRDRRDYALKILRDTRSRIAAQNETSSEPAEEQ